MTKDVSTGQLKLPIEFLREPDRNFSRGGRSFYFFDFDDNVVHLPTKIVLFHSHSGEEKPVSTSEYAEILPFIGQKDSEWEHFRVQDAAPFLSYRNFREHPTRPLHEQPLLLDMEEALKNPILDWRGPSWDFFVHAVNNNRPISVITARGHHPHTIRRAIDTLVLSGDLGTHPNYLSVYPVSHSETRQKLGDEDNSWTTAALKKQAIKCAVRDAFECYGQNPHHRFGMSDDDPSNVALIREAMLELKIQYPDNAFFVISTHGRQLVKEEIILSEAENIQAKIDQMTLFR